MLGRILKVEKKVRNVRIEKKNLTWTPVIVWKRKNPSPFRSSLECNHKMEMKYSDKGTLVQRQRYPLPSRSLQFFFFENIFDALERRLLGLLGGVSQESDKVI